MDLERSLAGISLDESPWRQHETQQGWSTGMSGPANGVNWGHVSPQSNVVRNVWHDPNTLAQNVNEALGITTNGWSNAPIEEYGKPIWSEAPPPPNAADFAMRAPGASSVEGEWIPRSDVVPNALWSDPLMKDSSPGPPSFGGEPQYWKQPGRGNWNQQGPPGRGGGGWNGGGMPVVNGPPPNQRHHMMPPRGGGGGGWPPNGMMHGGVPQPRYPDMSVPPPIDMQMHRGMPKPSWKPDGMAPNGGMRGGGSYQASNNFVPPGRMNEQMMGSYPPMGAPPSDDLMWHDPNGELKKWQRDTGVSVWGDPNKTTQRQVNNWMVPAGEEEELEQALQNCPIPARKPDGNDENRVPIQVPSKKNIVPMGWGSLPEGDVSNPSKNELGTEKWSEGATDCPWMMPPSQQSVAYDQTTGGWGPPAPQQQPPVSEEAAAIAEQLRAAVEKGHLDISILHQQMPQEVLGHISQLLSRIPTLEEAQRELDSLIDSVLPEGEKDRTQAENYMNAVQKGHYNRLIIEVTTAKIETTNLSKKIQRSINEAHGLPEDVGLGQGSAQPADPYGFFLE